jgi:enoyl-CoA hydratase/carnithine racemase
MAVIEIDRGPLTVSFDGGVVLIRFNRPEKRNAITQSMYAVLTDTLTAADADLAVGAVVLTGTNSVFSAGNDLTDLSAEADAPVMRFLETVPRLTVPVVAAVNGLAIGIGVTLLLHCDLVYAEPSATFRTPFVDLGIVPEFGSTLLLPRMIGTRRAAELLLTGRTIDARTAAEWGLITEVASPVLDIAVASAHALAAKPPVSFRRTKTLLGGTSSTIKERLVEEGFALAEQLGSFEFAEVATARAEHRLPDFGRPGIGRQVDTRKSE